MNTPSPTAPIQELRNRASRLIRAGRLEEAQSALQDLVRLAPQDVPACLELADLMYQRGQVRASSEPLLTACRHLPRHAPLLQHLISHLIARGEIVAARTCLAFLSQAPDPPYELLVSMAHTRFSLGEIESARQLMAEAMRTGFDKPSDYHTYAMLLQFSGDMESACMILEQCLERWPDFGDAIVPLVGMRKQTPESNALASIDEQLQSMPDPGADHHARFNRAEFEYARYKVLDKLRRYDEAWDSLVRCNSAMAELNPYDREAEEALVEEFLASPDVLDMPGEPTAGSEGPMPIFIVGMPRSGTTLLDRMLSSHSQVHTAGELIEFWRQLHWVADILPDRSNSLRRIIRECSRIDFAEVGARYIEQAGWRADGQRYFIDKLPANILMVAFIRRALPHAPILHMMRDPMDVCFSNYKAFLSTSAHSHDLEALAHYYTMYGRMCEHWRTKLPGAMLDVPYASLVSDPRQAMQRILAHCGLETEEACLHPETNPSPIATPSSVQIREPIHRRSIGEWRNYAEQLEPLRTLLG